MTSQPAKHIHTQIQSKTYSSGGKNHITLVCILCLGANWSATIMPKSSWPTEKNCILENLPTHKNNISSSKHLITQVILFLIIHFQHTSVKNFSPDSSNWADSVVNKGQEVSSAEELILWAQDNLERSPKHRNSHNVILNYSPAIRTDNADQTQQFRSMLIMADYWLLLV